MGSKLPRVVRMVAAATAIGLAAACGGGGGQASPAAGGDPAQPVELTFWSWVPDIQKAVDQFNAAHPGIKVKLETITPGPDGGYAKMLAAVKAGNAPDVAQVGYDSLPSFLVNGALEDVTEHARDDAATFVDWQWQTGVFGGKVYAIPQASGPMGFYYRKDLFDKWGIEAPKTWDDFAAAAATIRQKDKDAYISTFAANQAPWMISLAQQAGRQWFSTEGDAWKVTIDNPDTRRMAAFWQKMLDDKLLKTEADLSNAWYKDLQTGGIVGWIGGSWGDAIIRGNAPDTSGKWAVAPMPQWAGATTFTSASWAGGSASAILKGTDNPAAATEFAVWLNSDPRSVNTLLSAGYGWPSIKDTSQITNLQKDDTVFPFYGGQNIWDVFKESDAAVTMDWRWPPVSDALYASLTDNAKAAVQGQGTLTDAFVKTQQAMVEQLRAKGLNVVTGG
ncbi:multiple sugar transport system substrate-binding protein [Nonomuraea muscovyensis]|uniref:Multiple sugar transport system substrate-binding protein n=1 Tax=Nonomuraea muscovyensis TaxID=1124761 RepID=A0A7X0C8K6_9ACTN|nr:sugar ABC transporter substrate-binding protein [Nonomuraea muscovyensis]MBB6348689.1 multiple sugar transport system substrate-binding protein [Nonomuraea muscovyensis]